MAYATLSDVLVRDAFRATYTTTTTPSASQVAQILLDAAGQIDTWFWGAGYNAPFDAFIASGMVGTTVVAMLRNWNVTGAVLMIEDSAQQSDRRAEYEERWEDIRKQIFDDTWDFNLPRVGAKAYPRGPGQSAVVPPNPEQFTHANTAIGTDQSNGGLGWTGRWDL